MYPSVKFVQIENAVNYFLQNASKEDKKTAKQCLDMIKFGMDNTIVTFKDRYWIYGGNCPVEEKGLTIGGFESAFLADLVAAYIRKIRRPLLQLHFQQDLSRRWSQYMGFPCHHR